MEILKWWLPAIRQEGRKQGQTGAERSAPGSRVVMAMLAGLLPGAVLGVPATASAASESELKPVVVETSVPGPKTGFQSATVQGDTTGPLVTADTASLASEVPGAALNANGPLAGQIQYRGLFGPSNNVLIDGMHINPGGPNWMDPPLHYLPRAELSSLTVGRGIAPVADGIETFGVTVNARSRQIPFSDTADYQVHGVATLGSSTVDDGVYGGGMVGVANDHQRFDLVGERDRGSDSQFPGGTIRDSGYSRYNVGGDYGYRWGRNTLGAHFLFDDTGPTGNAVFPLDTEFLRTEIGRLDFRHEDADRGFWKARLYYIHVAHAMDNVTLRPTPDFNPMMPGPDARRVPASAFNWGFDLSRGQPLWGGRLTSGLDAYLARNSSIVTDPQVPAFFARIFNNAQRNLYSAFSQWAGPIARHTDLTLGARFTRVQMSAGAGQVAPGLPPPAQALTTAFNAADRNRDDNNVDLMGQVAYHLSRRATVQFALARKTRSPSYFERYGYIPLQTTAGLADGNNYVGDPSLHPEVAYQADLGFDWRGSRVVFTPHLFYSRIVHYIQGLPVTGGTPLDVNVVKVSTLNGDATPLRFSNVEAALYGGDVGWLWRVHGPWQLSGVLGYTRGIRLGASDNLYRIAPLHGSVELAYRRSNWGLAVEEVFAGSQRRISQANLDPSVLDPATAGYGLLGLSADYTAPSGTRIQVGVSNLLNHRYYDALSGYNRVLGSDVPVGGRLPGRGRNVYLQLVQRF